MVLDSICHGHLVLLPCPTAKAEIRKSCPFFHCVEVLWCYVSGLFVQLAFLKSDDYTTWTSVVMCSPCRQRPCLLAACYKSNRFLNLRASLLWCTPLDTNALPGPLCCHVEFRDHGTGATFATDFIVNNKVLCLWSSLVFSISTPATTQR